MNPWMVFGLPFIAGGLCLAARQCCAGGRSCRPPSKPGKLGNHASQVGPHAMTDKPSGGELLAVAVVEIAVIDFWVGEIRAMIGAILALGRPARAAPTTSSLCMVQAAASVAAARWSARPKIGDAIAQASGRKRQVLRCCAQLAHALEGHGGKADELGGSLLVNDALARNLGAAHRPQRPRCCSAGCSPEPSWRVEIVMKEFDEAGLHFRWPVNLNLPLCQRAEPVRN